MVITVVFTVVVGIQAQFSKNTSTVLREYALSWVMEVVVCV
jgi:hypothetical protein